MIEYQGKTYTPQYYPFLKSILEKRLKEIKEELKTKRSLEFIKVVLELSQERSDIEYLLAKVNGQPVL